MKFSGNVLFTSIGSMYKIHIILNFGWGILKNNWENVRVQSKRLCWQFCLFANIFKNNACICTPWKPLLCQDWCNNFWFRHFLIWWKFDIKSDQKRRVVGNVNLKTQVFFTSLFSNWREKVVSKYLKYQLRYSSNETCPRILRSLAI